MDSLRCKRYRIRLSGDYIYVVISYANGSPVEVFTTVPQSWEQNDMRKSFIEAINRLAAVLLQRAGNEKEEKTVVETVCEQLMKSSCNSNDYVSKLAQLLSL